MFDSSTRLPPSIDKAVYGISALTVLTFLGMALALPEGFNDISGWLLSRLTRNFGWAFVVGSGAFVAFSGWLLFSKYGSTKLGRDDEQPQFSTVSWFAMMFSAGMGIGLLFYGVSEPIAHSLAPPEAGIIPGTAEAERFAMIYAMFHWALHPWSIYAVVGLALAHAWYRKGRGGGFAAPFEPLLKGRAGPAKIIDVLAIFATLFGTATSLGLGAAQINGGLGHVLGVEIGRNAQVTIIAVLTACFVVSAFSGIERGIKWLSNINMVASVVLLFFLFVVGPTVFILNLAPSMVGNYVSELPRIATRTGAYGGTEWLSSWTIFYWAWWMSWAPFVGTFLARISRGRTVRQFMLGVIAAPSGVALIWFSVLGGAALHAQFREGVDISGLSQESQFFTLLGSLPLSAVSSTVVMMMIVIYFVTSADSASVVMGSLSSRGVDAPSRWAIVSWGLITGATAGILLWVGGAQGSGINALKNVAIIVAAPFLLIMMGLCVSLVKDFRGGGAEASAEAKAPSMAIEGSESDA